MRLLGSIGCTELVCQYYCHHLYIVNVIILINVTIIIITAILYVALGQLLIIFMVDIGALFFDLFRGDTLPVAP